MHSISSVLMLAWIFTVADDYFISLFAYSPTLSSVLLSGECEESRVGLYLFKLKGAYGIVGTQSVSKRTLLVWMLIIAIDFTICIANLPHLENDCTHGSEFTCRCAHSSVKLLEITTFLWIVMSQDHFFAGVLNEIPVEERVALVPVLTVTVTAKPRVLQAPEYLIVKYWAFNWNMNNCRLLRDQT